MQIRVGDLFVAGEAFSIFPGAWVVLGVNSHSGGRELLMLRPDLGVQWIGKRTWMRWEHFPAEVPDAGQAG